MKASRYGLGVFLVALLLLAACGKISGATTRQVHITETDFHIASNVTVFIPGTSYQFVIANKGAVAHEFMLMPVSENNMGMMPMESMEKLALAKVENIAPGETVTLDYTFPTSMAHSHPAFVCMYPGHSLAGMKLVVTVGA